jgi:hypothetical protein
LRILGVIDIVLVVHAAKRGRFFPWAYVVLLIPVFGALAYVCVELGSEWFGQLVHQARRRPSIASTLSIRAGATVH